MYSKPGFLLSLLFSFSVACRFEVNHESVVGHGQLMSFPSLWNEQTSTVVSMDRKNGNILLYPQMMAGSDFSVVGDRTYSVTYSEEVFIMYDIHGKRKFTIRDYSSTFPVVDKDVYILNEHHISAYDGNNGKKLWAVPFCKSFVVSGVKDVHDMFVVADGDTAHNPYIAVGFLLSGDGECVVETIPGKPDIVLKSKAEDAFKNEQHTPYIFYLDRSTGKYVKHFELQATPMDMVRKAIVKHDTANDRVRVTLVGLVTRRSDILQNVVSQYEGTKIHFLHQWSTTVTSFHAHNYLWSNADTDFDNDHIMMVADPTGKIEVSRAGSPKHVKKQQGLVMAMIDIKDGNIKDWTVIDYKGLITATYISWIGRDKLLLGGIWDGEQYLIFQEGVGLKPLERPVQGMLGFLAVFDTRTKKYLWVQEVAPEMAFPGHHIGTFQKSVSKFSIVTSPVFWDNAPSRHIDNNVKHNLDMIGLDQEDEVALVIYEFDTTSCYASEHLYTSADDKAWAKPSDLIHGGGGLGGAFATLAIIVLIVAFVAVIAVLAKQFDCSNLNLPLPFGRKDKVYKPVGGPQTDDDLFADDDDWEGQNNPNEVL